MFNVRPPPLSTISTSVMNVSPASPVSAEKTSLCFSRMAHIFFFIASPSGPGGRTSPYGSIFTSEMVFFDLCWTSFFSNLCMVSISTDLFGYFLIESSVLIFTIDSSESSRPNLEGVHTTFADHVSNDFFFTFNGYDGNLLFEQCSLEHWSQF